MSLSVKERLKQFGIELIHDQRVELDKDIEKLTKKKCDEGIHDISDTLFLSLVNSVRTRNETKDEPESEIIITKEKKKTHEEEILENVEYEQ